MDVRNVNQMHLLCTVRSLTKHSVTARLVPGFIFGFKLVSGLTKTLILSRQYALKSISLPDCMGEKDQLMKRPFSEVRCSSLLSTLLSLSQETSPLTLQHPSVLQASHYRCFSSRVRGLDFSTIVGPESP